MSDLSAKRTPSHNQRIWHCAYRRRDILAALLAANCEVALPAFREIEHERQYRRIKGEHSRWQIQAGLVAARSSCLLNAFMSTT